MVKLLVEGSADRGLPMILSYFRFTTSALIIVRWPGEFTTEPTTWTMGSTIRMPMRFCWMM